MGIKILPSTMAGSTVYTTTANVVSQQYANPYTKSCNGLGACTSYGAVVKCLTSIYQGVRACQTIYLLDKDGNLLDTDRLDYVTVALQNIYGCNVGGFDSRNLSDGAIAFPQVKYDGEVFKITPENFNDIMFGGGSPMFSVNEDVIQLHNGNIVVNAGDTATIFMTEPIEYNEKVVVDARVREPYGDPVLTMRANGSPNILPPNEEYELIMLTESDEGCMLEFGIATSGEDAGFILDEMTIRTVAGISHQGEVQICFSEGSTANMVPSSLTATVMFKFKDDDEIEHGSTQVVTCVPIGTVYKNAMLSTNDDNNGGGGTDEGAEDETYDMYDGENLVSDEFLYQK